MKTIYIVDAIGIHCGMNYYANSFRTVLRTQGVESIILSNYADNSHESYFENFYKGGIISKVYNLFIACIKLFCKVISDRKSIFVVFSYGTPIDFLLLTITMLSRNRIVDVHEVIMQGSENKKTLKWMFSFIYRHTNTVIIHSNRSEDFLRGIGYNGSKLFVPHFEYQTDEQYDLAQVSQDVQNLIKEKINILWFGNITYSKGIDAYIANINSLSQEIKERINVIIAGRSLDGVFEKCNTVDPVFSVIIKKLNDDEMIYLYTQSDYVVLPYRQTSQSGVLEMAFHYKKPVIVSDIPYFSMMLSKYPSFGIVTSIEQLQFTKTIESLINDLNKYYSEEDIYNYCHKTEIVDFAKEFKRLISKL